MKVRLFHNCTLFHYVLKGSNLQSYICKSFQYRTFASEQKPVLQTFLNVVGTLECLLLANFYQENSLTLSCKLDHFIAIYFSNALKGSKLQKEWADLPQNFFIILAPVAGYIHNT